MAVVCWCILMGMLANQVRADDQARADDSKFPSDPPPDSPNADPAAADPAAADPASPDPVMRLLLKRIEDRPNHSDSWRLLGSYQSKHSDLASALRSLVKALQLDPENAAAHFDYGKLLFENGEADQAREHFQQCVSLAPETDYANRIEQNGWLANLGDRPSLNSIDDWLQVQPAGYRIQTFDGADDLERTVDRLESDADPTLRRIRFFFETGVLYNSNVSLTPISRELINEQAESFQWLANPEIEWIALQRRQWRSGFLSRGFLTVNESTQSEFDLASLQAGGFVERDLVAFNCDWTARLDYVYSLDHQGNRRFGDRHSMTASIIQIRPDLDILYGYVTASVSDFADDGLVPTTSSLDGPSVSAGISRFFQTNLDRMPTFALGIDLETADTEGSDFRYRGVTTYGECTLQISQRLQLIPSAGTGCRDYFAFTGLVPRDEWTWRVQGKLRWQATEHAAISWVAGHDRFASDNEQFDAERTQGGMLMTVTY